jgi:hypothetical protein
VAEKAVPAEEEGLHKFKNRSLNAKDSNATSPLQSAM